MDEVRFAVVAAGLVCVAALAWQLMWVRRFGRRVLFAAPAGDPSAGVRYAFTGAMLPQAKESVMMNLPSYVAGLVFHAGVFTALGALVLALLGARVEGPAAVTLAALTAVGALAGVVLLVKRLAKPHLRGLSVADDFISNLLSTLFVGTASAAALRAETVSAWMLLSAVLLLYIPAGKIRHCVFFFSSRYHLGAFFGRRGTFPTAR